MSASECTCTPSVHGRSHPSRRRLRDDSQHNEARCGFARVLAIVASRSDAEVASLLALAQINQDRQTYFARLLLLAYVTVPLTVFALAAQMSPAWLARIFEQYPSAIGGGMAGAGLAVVIAHVNEARARLLIAMLQVIQLVRVHPDPQGPR